MAENETPDVLPDWANQTLILLWLLLFGGRWLFAPVLQLAGLLSAPQLAAWDEDVLLKLYLVLLAITCIVVALRAVRASQSGAQRMQTAGDGVTTNVEPSTMNVEPLTMNVEPSTVSTATPGTAEADNQDARLNGDDDIPQANGQTEIAPAGGDENP